MKADGPRITYLDGLRGIAAMMVFMIHTGGWGLRSLGKIGNAVADHGKYGVTVFFVVSAFSLSLAHYKEAEGNSFSYWRFYLRRFLRIAPMFYAVLCLYFGLQLHRNLPLPSLASISAHVTFANIAIPSLANDILSIEWSIAVEVGFYLIFPFILTPVRHRTLFFGLLAAVFMLPASRALQVSLIGDNAHYILPWNVSPFLLGMISFVSVRHGLWQRMPRKLEMIVIPSMALLLALQLISGEGQWSGAIVSLVTCAIIMKCSADKQWAKLFGVKPLAFIGTISYSVYLLHIFVGAYLGPFLSIPVTIATAACTYKFIEEPFNKLARKATKRPSMVQAEPAEQVVGG